jgi:tetratricopeptide (TPR) repeat protein
LSVTTRLRGAEDSDTLKTVQLLAASYGMSDQADESIRLFETLLDRTKSARGSDAPETLSVMHDLAVSYGKKQRWNEAIALQEQVVAISRRKNGPEHDQTLSELGILAVMYGQSGRLAKVIELTSERLSALRKVNGNDHPETLETIKFLASALWEAGQLKEALALNEEALKSIERTAPAPEVAAILSNIGFLLDATSRGEEAIASWQKAVALDPKLANTQYWLGRALLDRKRFAEAVRPLRAARQFYPNGPRAQDVAERLARAEAGAATKKEGL